MSAPTDRASRAFTALIALCAIIVTALLVRRELVPSASAAPVVRGAGQVSGMPIDNWEDIRAVGHRTGPEDAKVTIVVFSDFECVACGAFENRALPAVEARHAGQVAVVFRHWPLPYHRFARPAARAAECAGEQGRFQEFRRILFRTQDSLGLIPFPTLARRIGIPDTVAFSACTHRTEPLAVADRDSKAAMDMGALGTPAVVVNGVLLQSGTDSVNFNALIDRVVKTGQVTP